MASPGFCSRCRSWLNDRTLTQHAMVQECFAVYERRVAFYEDAAAREHRHVHELEDTIAALRAEAAEEDSE